MRAAGRSRTVCARRAAAIRIAGRVGRGERERTLAGLVGREGDEGA